MNLFVKESDIFNKINKRSIPYLLLLCVLILEIGWVPRNLKFSVSTSFLPGESHGQMSQVSHSP